MTNIDELLSSSKLPERSVPICLRGDLVAEHEELERQLAYAQDHAGDSLDAGSDVAALADALEAVEVEMRASTVEFRLRALPRPQFRALVLKHPPRRDDDGNVPDRDAFAGANLDTLFPALIRASVVAPVLTEAHWTALLEEKLTDRQYDDLTQGAWALNRREVDIPFSRAASRLKAATAGE